MDVNRLQEMVEDYKYGEKVDLKLLVSEFQNLLKNAKNLPQTDEENDSARKSRQAKNLIESLETLKTDMTNIHRNTDVGRANTIRDRLRKKLDEKKARKELEQKRANEKLPKMKGPDITRVNEVLSSSVSSTSFNTPSTSLNTPKMKGPDLSQIV